MKSALHLRSSQPKPRGFIAPPQPRVISTESGAFAAAVERPLYFALPSSTLAITADSYKKSCEDKMKNNMTELRQWILDACSKPGFSDMHIDRFSLEWKDRSHWIEGGMTVLKEAMDICTSTSCRYKLAMVFTLQGSMKVHGTDFVTTEQFESQFDHSPPSLFLADSGSEPWITSQAHKSVQTVPIPAGIVKQIFPVPFECEGLLMQYRPDEEHESSRTVWLLP